MSENPVLWRWQHILSISLLILTTLWGGYAGYLKKERGRLDFALDSVSSLASLKDKPSSDLKLMYRNKEIVEASVLKIYVENSGNIDLHLTNKENPADIENPRFKLILDEDMKILESTVLTAPGDSSVFFKQIESHKRENEISYSIELMNVDSYAIIELVVAGKPSSFEKQVMGLNLKSRDVLPNAHTIRPPWWHILIAFIASIVLPIIILKSTIKKKFLKSAQHVEPRRIVAFFFLWSTILLAGVILCMMFIAKIYDLVRLVV